MSDIGSKLKEIRLKHNLTMDELCERLNKNHGLNLSKSMVSRWENGNAEPMNSYIAAYAKEFLIDMNWLIGLEILPLPKRTVKIPILGSVPAGTPIEAITNIVGEVEIDEKLTLSGNYFALKIKGESMMPDIKDGDVVIVREQDSVETGEIAIVYVNGYEATCKKVIINKTNLILQPLNPTYEAQAFDWSEVHELPVAIVGKVVEARRFF